MQVALIHGVKARKNKKIPKRMLNWGLINSGGALIIPTLNIIKGIVKIITIKLAIAKFLLFKRFIDPEIEVIEVNTGELIRKV